MHDRPHLESETETHPGGKTSASGSVSAVLLRLGRRAVGLPLLMCHSAQPPHHPHLQFFMLVCFSIFWDEGRSITSNRFVFNMVQDHHLQLRSHPLVP